MRNYGMCPVCGTRLEVEKYFKEDEYEFTREQLLTIMIQNCMFEGDYPLPAKVIAEREGVSIYQVRKYMGILEKEGLVKQQKIWIKDNEERIFLQGWNITDKCRELEEYKVAKSYKEQSFRYKLKKRGRRINEYTRNRKRV